MHPSSAIPPPIAISNLARLELAQAQARQATAERHHFVWETSSCCGGADGLAPACWLPTPTSAPVWGRSEVAQSHPVPLPQEPQRRDPAWN
jgi:hypothetical protein